MAVNSWVWKHMVYSCNESGIKINCIAMCYYMQKLYTSYYTGHENLRHKSMYIYILCRKGKSRET